MAKESQTPEPATAPEIDPDHVNLDIETTDDSQPIDTSQTIEEAANKTEDDSSEDDTLYRQAASEVAIEEPVDQPPKKPKKSRKKFLVVGLVLLLLAVAGGWYFFLREKPAPAPSQAPEQTEAPQAIGYEPDAIAYTFRESSNLPHTLFWRLATGENRTQVRVLDRGDEISQFDVFGQTVVYSTARSVQLSNDGGRSYKEALALAPGEQVTSLRISDKGNVAVALLPDNREANTVKSISATDGTVNELFTSKSAGVFVESWNEDKQLIVYQEGCYNCDGNSFGLSTINLADKKVTKLLGSVDGKEVSSYAVARDGSKAVFVQGSIDSSSDGLGYTTKAPYKIQSLDIASNKVSLITTIGTAGETNENGTVRRRNILVGFVAGSQAPYYADGNSVQLLFPSPDGDGEVKPPVTLYEAREPIQHLPYVGEKVVIAGSGEQDAPDYTLVHYNIENQQATTIFEGDSNTLLFGVTTK